MMKRMAVALIILCGLCSCHPFIHGAVKANDMERVQAFVAKGHVNDREDVYQHTPLIIASYYGYTDIVEYLCQNGADLDAQAIDGSTALIYTAIHNWPDITLILLDKGASVDLKDRNGHTALYYAETYRNREVADLLKHMGATK